MKERYTKAEAIDILNQCAAMRLGMDALEKRARESLAAAGLVLVKLDTPTKNDKH